jgi:hypothetical protein
MKYDVEQLTNEANGLRQSRETAFQQYHQICGAVAVIEQMLQRLQDDEKLKNEKDEAVPMEAAA